MHPVSFEPSGDFNAFLRFLPHGSSWMNLQFIFAYTRHSALRSFVHKISRASTGSINGTRLENQVGVDHETKWQIH
jgi:hypothetical protein